MALKSTRKIITIILAVIMSISALVTAASVTIDNTFGTQKFITKHFVTDSLVAECEKQLDAKYEALEQKCGIPARVFSSVKTSFGTRAALEQATEYLFDENDSSLYNENRIDYFYGICVEYLEGNDFVYNEESVRNVATEAARIYSDCVGIHNADDIKYYIASVNSTCKKLDSVGALFWVVSLILLAMMYKDKVRAYSYAGISLVSSGFAMMIGSILAIITKAGADINVSPVAYQYGIYSMVKSCFGMFIVAGIILFIVGGVVLGISLYKLKLEESRKDQRFKKIVAKL